VPPIPYRDANRYPSRDVVRPLERAAAIRMPPENQPLRENHATHDPGLDGCLPRSEGAASEDGVKFVAPARTSDICSLRDGEEGNRCRPRGIGMRGDPDRIHLTLPEAGHRAEGEEGEPHLLLRVDLGRFGRLDVPHARLNRLSVLPHDRLSVHVHAHVQAAFALMCGGLRDLLIRESD